MLIGELSPLVKYVNMHINLLSAIFKQKEDNNFHSFSQIDFKNKSLS